jgi:hypothetical protein
MQGYFGQKGLKSKFRNTYLCDMPKTGKKETQVPKIKIQIEADDEEFDIEAIQEFLKDLQHDFMDDASASGHHPWIISVVNKNGSLTPLLNPEEEEDEEEEDDEWDDEHNNYDDFEEDDEE